MAPWRNRDAHKSMTETYASKSYVKWLDMSQAPHEHVCDLLPADTSEKLLGMQVEMACRCRFFANGNKSSHPSRWLIQIPRD